MTAYGHIGRYAEALDEARDLADLNEPRMSHAKILARNDRWSARRDERVRKGRPAYRQVHVQYEYRDGRIARSFKTLTPDPMFDLYAARKLAHNPPAYDADTLARVNVRYGELMARVTSPVLLPADRRTAARSWERAA